MYVKRCVLLTTYIGRRSVGRMHEPTFLILTALVDAPLHGYGIIQEVAVLSGDRVTLRPGTLYGALDRLVEQEMVVVDGEEVVDGRLRRYYRLTDHGAATLSAEVAQVRANAAMAAERLRRRAAARPSAAKPVPTSKPVLGGAQ